LMQINTIKDDQTGFNLVMAGTAEGYASSRKWIPL